MNTDKLKTAQEESTKQENFIKSEIDAGDTNLTIAYRIGLKVGEAKQKFESTKQEKPDFEAVAIRYSESIAIKYQEQILSKDQLKLYAKKDYRSGYADCYREHFEALQSHNAQLVEQVKKLEESIIEMIVTFNLSTSFTSIEDAKLECPKLFESKKKSVVEWIEQLKNK